MSKTCDPDAVNLYRKKILMEVKYTASQLDLKGEIRFFGVISRVHNLSSTGTHIEQENPESN